MLLRKHERNTLFTIAYKLRENRGLLSLLPIKFLPTQLNFVELHISCKNICSM